MTNTEALTALFFVLLLTVTPLAAQPQGEQADPPEQDTRDAVAPGAPNTAQPDPAQAGSAAEDTDDSPFDYEASEDISEDLSVSFPVDI